VTEERPLELTAFCVRGEPIAYADAIRAHFASFHSGDAWGPPWSTTWFHVPGLNGFVLDPSHRITAVGHAHIDTAWEWPIREAKRKVARSWSTQLALMDTYPDYVFAASQPAQYAWMKESYPDVYSRIKKKVAAGQWEPAGAMWVEADCNLPSGEALVRQLLLGKRFFMREFGYETRILWLPDVFGYPGNLLQLISEAGCDFFLTQKLSWNDTNKPEHHTFM
jgi:alpha-mannosidase